MFGIGIHVFASFSNFNIIHFIEELFDQVVHKIERKDRVFAFLGAYFLHLDFFDEFKAQLVDFISEFSLFHYFLSYIMCRLTGINSSATNHKVLP